MKKINFLAYILLFFVSSVSYALDIAWQATLPFSPRTFSVLAGPDGATTVNNNNVICHPFIVGELACGNMKNRIEILSLLHNLPCFDIIESDEILYFIEQNK